MYLEKLEIQGFKSFAHKNVLVFPGRLAGKAGVTAIVGPNGSGKSNVADAVRWALGEQSMKTLRGKKSEDIIFAGSDKKGRLGLAEVSLYLNNEDGQAPLDYAQVVITRRLYRDGESEYLLNGSRVRLLDIQMLLAKASFGQKTYSVIGQGLVENFLNTSLGERKEFFDEATGVKQYQIKRDDSLNKLKLSLDNLSQSQMLLAEIEPRLKTLSRQVTRWAKREELTQEFQTLAVSYYGRSWQELNTKLEQTNHNFLQADKIRLDKEKKRQALESELLRQERENGLASDFSAWQNKLNERQREKDALTSQLAKLDAWLEVKLEAEGKFDLSFLNNKQRELGEELAKADAELAALVPELTAAEKALAELQTTKDKLTKDQIAINDKINQFSKLAPASDEQIKSQLTLFVDRLAEAEAHDDLAQVRLIIAEIKQELQILLKGAPPAEAANLALWQSDLARLSEEREMLFERFHEAQSAKSTKVERQRLLQTRREQVAAELAGVVKKLQREQNTVDAGDKQAERQALESKLQAVNSALAEAREQFAVLQADQASKQAVIFSTQKNLATLQTELSALAGQLNEAKIAAARYETRLEDLEREIRDQLGDLAAVKNYQVSAEAPVADAAERLKQLRRQLDAIGDIDAEVEKEYTNTKERYDFLSTQVNDLTETIASLEQVIAELDGLIKERFDAEFKNIENKFAEYFKILFNGGVAKIIKVMAEDVAEEEGEAGIEVSFADQARKKLKALSRHDSIGLAGVDIMATPPGKKIQNISMLSGGERALTAIALIAAIISANPAPFVVLDEVDAALDEANSERLAKILDDLSHKTQFIAITHNRAMMRQAAILYGITMGEDGVSKLLSVKLEEVK